MYDETFLVREATTHFYDSQLTNEDGDGIDPADLESLELTLVDVVTGAVINSRDAQDALNANDVTLESDGTLEWKITPEDNVILNDARAYEEHMAIFRWRYPGSGTEAGHKVIRLIVENFVRIG
jgi:hypothetical protein